MKPSFYDRKVTIRTQEEMTARLAMRTGRVMAGGQAITAEGSSKTRGESSGPDRLPPKLEWMEPVRHGDGSGYVFSACGCWSVVKEKAGEEFSYLLFKRSDASLKGRFPTLQDAQKRAEEL